MKYPSGSTRWRRLITQQHGLERSSNQGYQWAWWSEREKSKSRGRLVCAGMIHLSRTKAAFPRQSYRLRKIEGSGIPGKFKALSRAIHQDCPAAATPIISGWRVQGCKVQGCDDVQTLHRPSSEEQVSPQDQDANGQLTHQWHRQKACWGWRTLSGTCV